MGRALNVGGRVSDPVENWEGEPGTSTIAALSSRGVTLSVGDVRREDDHRVDSGARMQVDADGARYWVRCSCGWTSEPSLTAVLAEAAGEQHRTLAATRRHHRP
jgi:hypothetical protein